MTLLAKGLADTNRKLKELLWEQLKNGDITEQQYHRLCNVIWDTVKLWKIRPINNLGAYILEQVLCGCKFVAIGQPLDRSDCTVHQNRPYPRRGITLCQDYRPSEVKKSPTHWPKCVCGEIAQQHD